MKSRTKELNDLILKARLCHYRLRRIHTDDSDNTGFSFYALTLKKTDDSFERRAASFFELLKSNLKGNEKLDTSFGCFKIIGNGYKIIYYLEGYKKHSDKTAYFENGCITVKLIRRMPLELAVKKAAHLEKESLRDVYSRLSAPLWIALYPNPAKRFVESVNFEKERRI